MRAAKRKNEKNEKSKTLNYSRDTFLFFFKKFRKEKKNFTVKYTGYTRTIEFSENGKIKKYFFSDEKTENSVFAISSILKSEVKNKHVDVDSRKINYFHFTGKLPKIENAVCIDINQAYPQCLLNIEAISLETYKKLMSLKKKSRLKCIGMLATNKTTAIFIEGKIFSSDTVREKTENFYFILQKIIGDLIISLSRRFKDEYLFFWFDGIYFKNFSDEKINFCIDFFEKNGFGCKVEKIKNLQANENNIIYWKENKRKILPLIKNKKVILTDNFLNLKTVKV